MRGSANFAIMAISAWFCETDLNAQNGIAIIFDEILLDSNKY